MKMQVPVQVTYNAIVEIDAYGFDSACQKIQWLVNNSAEWKGIVEKAKLTSIDGISLDKQRVGESACELYSLKED
jgi:hypothetical protein